MNDQKKNLEEAQSLLDDAKEQIPESLYLTLSNINKKLFDNKEKNMYVVTYLDMTIKRPMKDVYKLNTQVKKQYITLNDEQFQIYQKAKTESFEKKGYYLPCTCSLMGLDLSRLVTNPMIDLYSGCCDQDEDESEVYCCESPYNHEISLDFDIRILDIHKI